MSQYVASSRLIVVNMEESKNETSAVLIAVAIEGDKETITVGRD
jgi:hypothetical protein